MGEDVTFDNASGNEVEAGYSVTNEDGDAASNINDFDASSGTDITFDDGLAVTEGTLNVDEATDVTITASDATLALGEDTEIDAGSYEFVDGAESNLVASGSFGLFTSDGEQVAISSGDSTSWEDMDTNQLFADSGADLANIADVEHGDTVEIKGDGGIDVSTQSSTDSSISTIDEAIGKVSTERSKLGAVQNRLDYYDNQMDRVDEDIENLNRRLDQTR